MNDWKIICRDGLPTEEGYYEVTIIDLAGTEFNSSTHYSLDVILDQPNCFGKYRFFCSLPEINHPPHYTSHLSKIECIQVTRHMNFNIGNVIKYLWRYDKKHEIPIIDLKKALWYLNDEIKRLEGKL